MHVLRSLFKNSCMLLDKRRKIESVENYIRVDLTPGNLAAWYPIMLLY